MSEWMVSENIFHQWVTETFLQENCIIRVIPPLIFPFERMESGVGERSGEALGKIELRPRLLTLACLTSQWEYFWLVAKCENSLVLIDIFEQLASFSQSVTSLSFINKWELEVFGLKNGLHLDFQPHNDFHRVWDLNWSEIMSVIHYCKLCHSFHPWLKPQWHKDFPNIQAYRLDYWFCTQFDVALH